LGGGTPSFTGRGNRLKRSPGVDMLDGGDGVLGWTPSVAALFTGMAPTPETGHCLRTRR
jgi:hypothetical protein